MQPEVILKSTNGGPAREVPLDGKRLAAMLATNDRMFPDERALMRHLRRGGTVRMILSDYRLRIEDRLRLAA